MSGIPGLIWQLTAWPEQKTAYGDNEPEYTEDDPLEGRDLLQAQRPVMNHVWDNRIDDETWSSPNEPE